MKLDLPDMLEFYFTRTLQCDFREQISTANMANSNLSGPAWKVKEKVCYFGS